MGTINRKFLHFKTYNAFETERRNGNVSPDSIVCIQDKQLIYTHNTFYCSATGFEKAKGYFKSFIQLTTIYPTPSIGDWAIVLSPTDNKLIIASCSIEGMWELTSQEYDRETFDVDQFVKKSELDLSKFVRIESLNDYLKKSELNLSQYVKTSDLYEILRNSLSQNTITVDNQLSDESTNPVQNKSVTEALNRKLESSDLEGYAKEQYVRNAVNDRILEVTNAIQDQGVNYNIREDAINDKIQQLETLINEIKKKYISWLVDGEEDYYDDSDDSGSSSGQQHMPNKPTRSKMLTLTEEEYQQLVQNNEVEEDVYYFTYIPEVDPNATWGFGDEFPIIFRDKWTFGGTFPITFSTTSGIGEFPITLN